MNKVTKYSLIGVGSFLGLVLAALILIPMLFNLNDYKDEVADIVHDVTGRTLVLGGDIEYTLFPILAVEINDVAISNAKGFEHQSMAHVDRAHVSIEIIPLLSKEIDLGHITLEGVSAYLGRNAEGDFNWDDLVGKAEKVEAEVQKAEDGGVPINLSVSGVTIKDTTFVWHDLQSDLKVELTDINAEIGDIATVSTFPMEASLNFTLSNPQLKGTVGLDGTVSIDLDKMVFGGSALEVTAVAEGEVIPGGKVEANTELAEAIFELKADTASVTGLAASAYGATVHVDATAEGVTEGVKKAVANVTVDPLNAKELLAALGIAVPETSSPDAMTAIEAQAEATYMPDDIQVKIAKAVVDGCAMDGQVRLKLGKKPYYFARLNVGDLNLDQYLPPKKEGEAEPDPDEKKDEKPQPVYDVEMMRQLHVDAEANVASLTVSKIRIEKIKAAVKAKDGVITVKPVSLGLYSGSVGSAVQVNVAKKTPTTEVALNVDGVDLGALMMDMSGEKSVAGVLDLETGIATRGNYVQDMVNSANGMVKFNLDNGVFPGVDLFKIALLTHERKSDGGKIEAEKSDSTSFGQVSGSCVIKDGVIANDDMEVKAPGLRAEGKGLISLPTKDIDYIVKVKLVASQKGQGGTASKDMYGVMVPVRVGGKYDDPLYWVSIAEYIKALAGVALDLGGGVVDATGNVVGGVADVTGNVVGGVAGGVTGAVKGVGKGVGSIFGFGGDDQDNDDKEKGVEAPKE